MPETARPTLAEWWRTELETASKELDSGRVDEARTRLELASQIEYGAKIAAERAPSRSEAALRGVIAALDLPRDRVGYDDPLEQEREDRRIAEDAIERARRVAEQALAVEEPF